MAVTLKQVEAIPAAYPVTPDGLSAAAAALDPVAIWQRIESYTAHRWTARAVVWTVEGAGDWQPPLSPATLTSVEVWDGAAWVEAFPAPSPLGGYALACTGPYRITGTVGGGAVPGAVSDAFRRLAEYSTDAEHPSHTAHSIQLGGSLNISFDRPSTWIARAMQNSGAADLLRNYRRAA